MPLVRQIFIGNNKVEQIPLGASDIKAVYVGSTMVWGGEMDKLITYTLNLDFKLDIELNTSYNLYFDQNFVTYQLNHSANKITSSGGSVSPTLSTSYTVTSQTTSLENTYFFVNVPSYINNFKTGDVAKVRGVTSHTAYIELFVDNIVGHAWKYHGESSINSNVTMNYVGTYTTKGTSMFIGTASVQRISNMSYKFNLKSPTAIDSDFYTRNHNIIFKCTFFDDSTNLNLGDGSSKNYDYTILTLEINITTLGSNSEYYLKYWNTNNGGKTQLAQDNGVLRLSNIKSSDTIQIWCYDMVNERTSYPTLSTSNTDWIVVDSQGHISFKKSPTNIGTKSYGSVSAQWYFSANGTSGGGYSEWQSGPVRP